MRDSSLVHSRLSLPGNLPLVSSFSLTSWGLNFELRFVWNGVVPEELLSLSWLVVELRKALVGWFLELESESELVLELELELVAKWGQKA